MLNRRSFLSAAVTLPAAATVALTLPNAALAMEPAVFARDGVAINGADPVAYFTDGAPIIGSAAFAHDWNGATWHFASAANRDMFAADPERYAPAFGGYCAWAAAQGYIAPTVPEAWAIHEGRLYLNASLRINRRWARDIPGNIARGEANWPGILG